MSHETHHSILVLNIKKNVKIMSADPCLSKLIGFDTEALVAGDILRVPMTRIWGWE